MKRRPAEVVDIGRARRKPVEVRGQRVGRLVGWSTETGPLVDYVGNPHGPLGARTTVPLDAARVTVAIARSREVLLAFEEDRSDRPIVVGLLQPPPGAPDLSPDEARVDGRRVVLEGKDEIVLRCGAATITLRRNGRIVVRGAYVETSAAGVNRIKGGSVKIN